MLQHEVKYKDFNGDDVVEDLYFHLNKPELIDLEVEYERGFESFLKQIINTKDRKELVGIFKKIVLMAYGQKSPDGRRFVKSEEMRKDFEQSIPYEIVYMQMIEEDDFAGKFIVGIMPAEFTSQIEEGIKELQKSEPEASGAPKPPVTPTA